MRATNEAGELFELREGQWVKIGRAKPDTKDEPTERLSSGAINAAMVAAGDVLSTMGRNARGLIADVRGDTAGQASIAAERQDADAIRARLQSEAPIASAVGAALPSLATMPLGMGVGSLGMMSGRVGQIATQLGVGGLMGGLSEESGDVGGGAAQGGALAGAGMLAGNMISRVAAGRAAMAAQRSQQAAGAEAAAGMAGSLQPTEQALIEGARRAGLVVTPGQSTGSRTARQFEAALGSNPWTSAPLQQIDQANTARLDKLAARAMGQDAADVGPAVRAAAEKQIGDAFSEVGAGIGKVETGKLHAGLKALDAEDATGGLPNRAAFKILKRFESGMTGRAEAVAGEAADVMSGKALVAMRSEVARDMRAAFAKSQPDEGQALAKVLDLVDDTIAKAARDVGDVGLVRRYDQARERWSVLRMLDRGGASIDGHVMPGQAARIMKSSDKGGFWGLADETGGTIQRQGTGVQGEAPLGDFYDALRFRSSQLGRDIVGNSGTATRSAVGELMAGGSTVGLGLSALRRLTASPVVKAYANMSPEAAALWGAAAQGAAAAPGATPGAVGSVAARILGGQ